jgi:hypothetical protein
MRLLLDECVPRRLKRELTGHQVLTVRDAGWAGLENGALLRAASGQFDAVVTVDQDIEYQQNLTGLQIAPVIIVAPGNDIDDLRPPVPAVLQALTLVQPGTSVRVGG